MSTTIATEHHDDEPHLTWCGPCDRPRGMCEHSEANTPAAIATAPNTTAPDHETDPNTPAEHEGPDTEHALIPTADTDRTRKSEHPAARMTTAPDGGRKWTRTWGAWLAEWGALLPIWVLAGALGVAGFAVSFFTVETKMRPYFGDHAWLVPAGVDLGIIVFTLLDIVLARKGTRIPWMRYVPWALTAATIYLNVTSYSVLEAQVAHAVLPSLWVVFCEAIARIMKLKAKEEAKTTRAVPLMRWICAPVATVILWRAMHLWAIDSYEEALWREEDRQLAKAVMTDEFGSVRKSPRTLKVRYRQRKITVAEVLAEASARRGGKSTIADAKPAPAVRRAPSDRRSAPAESPDRTRVRPAGVTERPAIETPTAPIRSRPVKAESNTGDRTNNGGRPARVRLSEALAGFQNEGVPNPSVRELAARAGTSPSTAHTFVTGLKRGDGQ